MDFAYKLKRLGRVESVSAESGVAVVESSTRRRPVCLQRFAARASRVRYTPRQLHGCSWVAEQ